MIVVYGLKNCDSCRKAMKILAGRGQASRFHDLRDDGLPAATLSAWLSAVGWEVLLNRRSTTWRELPEDDKKNLDASRAAQLLARHPTLVKRPVVESAEGIQVGFGPAEQAALSRLAGA
jgi:Spx/MgsR family transcriptional regulator